MLMPLKNDMEMCLISTLKLFLEKAKHWAVGDYSDTMFFVEKPKIKPASIDTIAKWIENSITEIGYSNTAHSTRGVSASKALNSERNTKNHNRGHYKSAKYQLLSGPE
ncbi:hypothetical protein BB558_002655, partial [Smittium angustum]